jgi:hypothetical protein
MCEVRLFDDSFVWPFSIRWRKLLSAFSNKFCIWTAAFAGGLHCSDVFGATKYSSPAVAQTLHAVEEKLGQWLQSMRRRRA